MTIKRFICALVCAVLLAGTLSGCVSSQVSTPVDTAPQQEAASQQTATPQQTATSQQTVLELGKVIEGFEVKQIGELAEVNAQTYFFEHQKTGAQVIFVKNDDPELAFTIGFHTEPSDDSGMLHILEHSVCASSEKYPAKDGFFDAYTQTYNSYMNAATFANATIYPLASLSENQLERLADYYLSCAFNSSIRTKPEFIMREGWRYELADKDAELTINGIVYNEMKGVFGSIQNTALYETLRALFPTTYRGLNSGGVPGKIPTLSYEESVAFYDKCYNPSNSVSILYGDMDVTRFLRLMDKDYFSKYDKVEKSERSEFEPAFDSPKTADIVYPASADSQSDNAEVCYAIAMNELVSSNVNTTNEIGITALLLGDNSSVFMQHMNKSGLASSYSLYADYQGEQYCVLILASDVAPENIDKVQPAIMEALTAQVATGFDSELIKSTFSGLKFSTALARNSSNVGMEIAFRLGNMLGSGHLELIDPAKSYADVESAVTKGYFENIVQQQFIGNTHAVLTVTRPQKGLLEKQAADEKQRLAELKASMTDEQVQEIVDQTKAMNEFLEGKTDPATIKKMQAVTPQSVEKNIVKYETNTVESDGVQYLTATVENPSICRTELLLDLSDMTADELHALNLYTELIGESTESLTVEQTSVKGLQLVNSYSTFVKAISKDADHNEVYPALCISFYAMNDSYSDALDYVFETALNTKIADNADKLAQNIDSDIKWFADAENINSFVAPTHAEGYTDKLSALQDGISGGDYLTYLQSAQKLMDEKPEELFTQLESARKKAFNKKNMNVLWAGSKNAQQDMMDAVRAKLAPLDDAEQAAVAQCFTPIGKNTAYIANTVADYSCRIASVLPTETRLDGAASVLSNVMNFYALDEIRFKGGAYGASAQLSAMKQSLFFSSYRDPDFTKSLAAYDTIADYVKDLAITADELNNYKLSALSGLLLPTGEFNMAFDQLNAMLSHKPKDSAEVLVEQIVAAEAGQLNAYESVVRWLNQNAATAVITSSEKYNANKTLFDQTIVLP